MKKIIVIGGGAAGMMASIIAARNGAKVYLFDKNEKLGKKLYITGKGRCNITNASDIDTLFSNVISNPRFLYSAFDNFTNEDTINFFNEIGLRTKIERGNRVFPLSDHSSDVIQVLYNEMNRWKVKINLLSNVKKIYCTDGTFFGILLANGERYDADACIVATGGLSYHSTGSTGDGYRFASELGHTLTELSPALTSIHVLEEFVTELEGLSLKNVRLSVTVKPEPKNNNLLGKQSGKKEKKKKRLPKENILYDGFGEMLFTHFGVSGPLVLSASSYLAPYMNDYDFLLHLDLKPALSEEQLDTRILKDFEEMKNKQFKNSLDQLLPQKVIHVIIKLSGIESDKQVNAITKEERIALVKLIKDLTFHVKSLGGYNEAVITKGGISVKEINPSTMESKLIRNLYFAGEVLDLDALTGGYNLQIAWSTGYTAGLAVARENLE